MQRIAPWLNLSHGHVPAADDTVEADYCARISTLAQELPFAAHATLGCCHAWLEAGGRQGLSFRNGERA